MSEDSGSARILVVEDERAIRWQLVAGLEDADLGAVTEAADVETARRLLGASRFDVVLLDLGLPPTPEDPIAQPGAGLAILDDIHAASPDAPRVLVVTAEASPEIAVDAMKRGAFDYLRKPFDKIELQRRVDSVLRLATQEEDVRELRAVVRRASGLESIVHRSEKMARVIDRLKRVARGDSTVLIRGETGTGKELVARAIHHGSSRANRPYAIVDTPAIPASLLEDELFGHVKGAFTSAAGARRGKVEMARGGTLFFDEIGDMEPALQAKLLRLLQERQFQSVGGSTTVDADVRIVAATHQNLEQGVKEGWFRRDLYYRLNVVPIDLPPLRDRPEDVVPLAIHFLGEFNRSMGTRVKGLSPEAAELLTRNDWPGNVRQLRNVIEQLTNLVEDATDILGEDVRAALDTSAETRSLVRASSAHEPVVGQPALLPDGFPLLEGDLRTCLERLEITLINRALDQAKGNRTKAAALLGLSRPALYGRLERHGLGDRW